MLIYINNNWPKLWPSTRGLKSILLTFLLDEIKNFVNIIKGNSIPENELCSMSPIYKGDLVFAKLQPVIKMEERSHFCTIHDFYQTINKRMKKLSKWTNFWKNDFYFQIVTNIRNQNWPIHIFCATYLSIFYDISTKTL